MPAPLEYSGVGTPGNPSGDRADGTGGVGASAPGLEGRKLKPLHWLVDGHWLGRWRTPFLLKIWRYGAGSIVAFLTSTVMYYVCFSWLRLGAISSTWVAFIAGAVPNWILNRRWAWEKRGREGMGRETTLYLIVSAVSLLASSGATKLTAMAVSNQSRTARDLLVTFSYMASVVILSVLKYVVYDRFVFIDRRRAAAVAVAPAGDDQGQAS